MKEKPRNLVKSKTQDNVGDQGRGYTKRCHWKCHEIARSPIEKKSNLMGCATPSQMRHQGGIAETRQEARSKANLK